MLPAWMALLGALPALAAMAYVDRLDRKRPEPRSLLRKVAFFGAVSALPCILYELQISRLAHLSGYANALFQGFVVAATVEEAAKAACVRWFAWDRPEFDERMDGIVYGTRAGLGFALLENIGYLLGARSTTAAFVGTFAVRAVLCIPLHAICGGLTGYYAARRRFDRKGPGWAGGYLLAVLLHGAYDAAFFAVGTAAQAGQYAVLIPAMIIPPAIVLLGVRELRRLAREAVAADDTAAMHAAVPVPAFPIVLPMALWPTVPGGVLPPPVPFDGYRP